LDDPDLEIHITLDLLPGVTAAEVKLLEDLLPELLKDLLWLQDDKEP
jgi:hypothetical protein